MKETFTSHWDNDDGDAVAADVGYSADELVESLCKTWAGNKNKLKFHKINYSQDKLFCFLIYFLFLHPSGILIKKYFFTRFDQYSTIKKPIH